MANYVAGNTLPISETPTAGSSNPISSGGVYTALQNKQDALVLNINPVMNTTYVASTGLYHNVSKVANIVCVSLNFETTSTRASSSSVLFTGLPAPISEIASIIVANDGSAACIALTSSGEIIMDGSEAKTSTWYRCSFSYVAQ